MKKYKKRALKRKITRILNLNLIIVILLIATTAIFLLGSFSWESTPITGLVASETILDSGEEFSASAANENNISNTDIQVWQGQYYKGREFQVGTYEFNFTVYDAQVGGGGVLLKYNYFNNR